MSQLYFVRIDPFTHVQLIELHFIQIGLSIIKLNFQTPFHTFITIYTFRLQITISPFLLSIALKLLALLRGMTRLLA